MPTGLIQTTLGLIGPLLFFGFIAIWFFTAAVKIVQEYERPDPQIPRIRLHPLSLTNDQLSGNPLYR